MHLVHDEAIKCSSVPLKETSTLETCQRYIIENTIFFETSLKIMEIIFQCRKKHNFIRLFSLLNFPRAAILDFMT